MSGTWLDTQIQVNLPVPKDIEATGIIGEETLLFNPFKAFDRRSAQPIDNNGALIRILKNTEIDIMLRTIGNAFFPRVVTVGTSPTLLIKPNRAARGYILINPNSTTSGAVGLETIFPAATVFAVGLNNSANLNVSGYGGAAFYLNITAANAGNTDFQVAVQTLDPVSGNWATAQSDIFGTGGTGIPAVLGTYYANVGAIGIDNQMRLQVSVAGGTVTGSIGATLKPSLAATVAGAAAFIGGPDVNTTVGFPLISGQKETFYLRENTAIYGIAVASTTINIFELQ